MYLVTGTAGFIGRSIAAALLARGETVRGIDSFITGKRSNLAGLEAMEFIEGDLADPATCAEACKGVEYVFHEAALASVPRSVADPAGTNLNCVTATLNLLVAAKEAGVRRVVYAGSSSAYGDTPTLPKREEMLPNPISPYAVAKLAGEHYMRAFNRVYGMETVVRNPDGRNPLLPNEATIPDTTVTLERTFYNNDRLNEDYLKTNLTRLREAYQTWRPAPAP